MTVHCQFHVILALDVESETVPLDAVKVMTTMLPNIDSAIMPDMTRGAAFVPNTSVKNKVAMSSLVFNLWSNETAHSCAVRKLCIAVSGLNLHMQRSQVRTTRSLDSWLRLSIWQKPFLAFSPR